MLTNINNNYTLNTNYMLQGIAELERETQQTPNITPVAQEVTPKTTTKTPKTTKKAAKATLSTKFKSITTQHGYFIPSTLKNEIVETTYNTILSIDALTKGYTLGCEINEVQQTSVDGDIYYTNWLLKGLQPKDTVKITVIGGKADQVITYTINEKGVTTDAPEGIKGTHHTTLDIQDKYRKAAQLAVETPAPSQEETTIEAAPTQIEEETVPAATRQEQVLTFGKHAGKSLSTLDSSYLKWLVSHESRLNDANRWACTAAKVELAARQAQQEKSA